MHELSIVLSLIDIATEEAERHGGKRVVALHLRLGPLSGVIREALESAFELAREGTALENARLMIEDVPLLVYCPRCLSNQSLPSLSGFECPQCGTPTGQVIQGKELELTALEIDS